MITSDDRRLDAVLRRGHEQVDAVDAECLLAHALRRSRTWIHAHGDAVLDASEIANFDSLLQRRLTGEPVAYLVGTRGFWCLDLAVTTDTLIPRPETELLVELALARLPVDHASDVLDLGTGTGAIALALAHERPRARVVATDASLAALAVAQRNAERLGIGNVSFRHGSWLEPVSGDSFDVIASNPPYIAEADRHLQEGDLRHEPPAALISGVDGLDAMRSIVRQSTARLLRDGWLLLEHGWQQGDAVRGLMLSAGYVEVSTHRDLEGRERVTQGRRR